MVLADCLFYAFFRKKSQIIDKWERKKGRENGRGREGVGRERGTCGEQPSLTKCSKAPT